MAEKEIILITGASSELLKRLAEKIDTTRYVLHGISRAARKDRDAMTYLQGDVRDREFVARACEGVAMIIHGAAVTHAMESGTYMEVNLEGTRNLVDCAIENEVSDFIFISSRAAGHDGGAYSLSKLKAEEYIRAKLQRWLVFQPAEVFGTGKGEGVEKLLSDIATKRIIPCPVGLTSKLYPVWIEDVVEIMFRKIFSRPARNEVVVVSGREGFTFRDLATHLAQRIDKRIVVLPVPRPVMFAFKRVMETTGIDFGLVPDQVPRLYGRKPHAEPDKELLAIGDYFEQMASNLVR